MNQSRSLPLAVVALLAALPGFPDPAEARPRFLGVDRLVNDVTEGEQRKPAASCRKNGRSGIGARTCVLGWGSNGTTLQLAVRAFGIQGLFLGPQVTVPTSPLRDPQRGSVVSFLDANENLVSVFGVELADGSVGLVDGETGDEEVVLGLGLQAEWFPTQYLSLFANAGLALSLVPEWSDTGDTDGAVVGQVYNRSESGIGLVGSPFAVSTYTTGSALFPDLATGAFPIWYTSRGEGGDRGEFEPRFLAVWESSGSPGDDDLLSSIQARLLDETGAPLGPQFQVNTGTTGFQRDPAVAGSADGEEFLVVWTSDVSPGDDDSLTSIVGRRVGQDGSPIGAEFQVNSATTGFQYQPSIDVMRSGRFVVVWTDYRLTQPDIAGRIVSPAGIPLEEDFRVNSWTTGFQNYPQVSTWDEEFVVVWEGPGAHNGDPDASIQMRGTFGVIFDDGFESGDVLAWGQ